MTGTTTNGAYNNLSYLREIALPFDSTTCFRVESWEPETLDRPIFHLTSTDAKRERFTADWCGFLGVFTDLKWKLYGLIEGIWHRGWAEGSTKAS